MSKKPTDPTWDAFVEDLNGLLKDLEDEEIYDERIEGLKKKIIMLEVERNVWKDMFIKSKKPDEFINSLIENDKKELFHPSKFNPDAFF